MRPDTDRPGTSVPTHIGLAGLLGVTVAYAAIVSLQTPALLSILLLLASCAAPMWWLEYKRHRAISAGTYGCDKNIGVNHLHRLLGVIVAALLFVTSVKLQLTLSPEWTGGLYDLMSPMAAIAALWIGWQLLRNADIASTLDELGHALVSTLTQKKLMRSNAHVILGWIVKAFFLPLMLAWSYTWLAQAADFSSNPDRWTSFFTLGMAWLFAVDTAFATIGYISTSPRIGAEIRSVDTTWLGWASALACYPPLSILVLRQWLDYKDGLEWQAWLHEWPITSSIWGMAILVLTAIYTWATVAFGPRFSNLTHRGVITSGPYRFTKHPAYLCKNLSWWLISIPFVSTAGAWEAAANCLALVGVNAIYWIRARTEERHLMRDETYRLYAQWISSQGIFAKCSRIFRTARQSVY